MSTALHFQLKTVGSPNLKPDDVSGTLQPFLQHLSLCILWRMSWPAERLLLPKPGVTTSERWSNNTSYCFWALTVHHHCAKRFYENIVLLNPLKTPVRWTNILSWWPHPNPSPAKHYDCLHLTEKLKFREVKFPQITQLADNWTMSVWQLRSFS